MPQFTLTTYPDALQRMINRVVARTELSDLTDTSVFKHILAAIAREIDDASFQASKILDGFSIDKATGADLDARAAEYNPNVVSRRVAINATGNLEFTRTTPAPGAIIIAEGTEVQVPGEDPPIVAVTTAVGTIPAAGLTSGNVPAIIADAGERGNVAANQLTAFKSTKPSGVDAVDNPSVFTGGADQETDDSLRARLKALVETLARSTVRALEFFAGEVELASGQAVVFAKAVEDLVNLGYVYLYIDDGTGNAKTTDLVTGEILTFGTEFPGDQAQGGEVYLQTDNWPIDEGATINVTHSGLGLLVRDGPGANGYTLNPASGQIRLNTALVLGDSVTADYTHYTGLIQEVQKVIDGDPNDRVNYPGVRAAGVLVQVLTPTVVNITADLDITVQDGYNQTTVADNVRTEIAAYINGLGIGNDVIRAEIIERTMAVEGMYDVTLNTPAANISILDDQLPRVNNAATDIVIT